MKTWIATAVLMAGVVAASGCAMSDGAMMKKDDGMMKKDDGMMKKDDKMMEKK